MKLMKFYIGLIGSGKTTLYRKLNEEKTEYAVEIELPQSCTNDEELKLQLFNAFYKSKNIDSIIAHPYYLPKNFKDLISESDEVIFLDIDYKTRLSRIKKRSKRNHNKCVIFPKELLDKEEIDFKKFKEALK